MIRTTRRTAIACALALVAGAASAQDFPARPVKILVPQTPGGASDALARIIAQKLTEKWGQPVVVENRPGAGGNVGMEAVAKSPADGYTLLMSYVGSHAINGSLYKKLPFDPEKDFSPVATLATLPFVLCSLGAAIYALGEIGNEFAVVPDQFVADRDTVVALGHLSWKHKSTGEPASVKMAHVWTFERDVTSRNPNWKLVATEAA